MNKPNSLKEALKNKIPKEILNNINRSFEVVGNLAIIEIDENLIQYENTIAQTLLEIHPHITTVVKKDGNHGGTFRTQSMKVLAGVDTTIATYKENGVTMQLDTNDIYFSTKLSTEREQLAKEVKPNTNQLVLFSGSGPYTFVITRKEPNISQITSVEINPSGHEYALKNLELNKNNLKHSNIFKTINKIVKENEIPFYDKFIIKNLNYLTYQFYNIDANLFKPTILSNKQESLQIIDLNQSYKQLFNTFKDYNNLISLNLDELSNEEKEKALFILILNPNINFEIIFQNNKYSISTQHEKNYLYQLLTQNIQSIEDCIKYDKIFMPLPKDAELFLRVAFENAKPNCIVHMYDFLHENEFPHKSENAVKEFAEQFGKEVEIIKTRKVGQYSPRKYRVCCDFKILN